MIDPIEELEKLPKEIQTEIRETIFSKGINFEKHSFIKELKKELKKTRLILAK